MRHKPHIIDEQFFSLEPNSSLSEHTLHSIAFNLQFFTTKEVCPINQFPHENLDQTPSFQHFLIHLDSLYLLLRQTIENFWNDRVPKKRTKMAARDQLAILLETVKITNEPVFLAYTENPNNSSNYQFLLSKWLGNSTYTTTNTVHTRYEREKHWKQFLSSTRTFRNPTTSTWTRPPGLNSILLNEAVRSFYKFTDGSYLFPKDYKHRLSTSFFHQPQIPDGAILNPPYSNRILEETVSFLLKVSREQRAVFAILVPFWPTALWFKSLQYLKIPCLLLNNNLYYRRGIKENYSGKANF